MFSVLYANLAIIVSPITNGHHSMIRAVGVLLANCRSGLGHRSVAGHGGDPSMLGIVFVLGVRLATPLILALLVVEIALGLIARAAPAINLQAVSQPLRIVLGLVIIATLIQLHPRSSRVTSRRRSNSACAGRWPSAEAMTMAEEKSEQPTSEAEST